MNTKKIFNIPEILSGALILGAVAMVIYSQWLITRTLDQHKALISLSEIAQREIVLAHLWFEEALAEDKSIDLERDVYQHIDNALDWIAIGLKGGQTDIGELKQVKNNQLRHDLAAVKEKIGDWRKLVEVRWKHQKTTGRTGEKLDQEFDEVFNNILDLLQKFSNDLNLFITQDRESLRRFNALIILFLIALFGSLAVVAFRHRRAIQAKNAELEILIKERTAQLSRSETRTQAILDNTVDGIITIDERGMVESFNPAAERIFGYKADEIIGQSVNLLMAEPDKSKHGDYIGKYLATGQAKIIGIGREVVGQHKDGSIFPMDLAVSEMIIGEKKMFVGMVRDITERKRAEKQRDKLLKDLERANNELKDFAYIVSHDLKEPLRGISSLTQWIAEDHANALEETGREKLDLLRENTMRMHHLIEDILAYSRIGRDKPAPVRLDSGKIAKEVIDSLTKPDTIEIRIEDTLPEVVYHQTHLAQIFQNLIGNAVNHLGKPSGEITVSCREDGPYWEFRVRDNGAGIKERHFERIFKIFQTLDRKNYAESTGVGLSLVKKIAEIHGGKVWVESTVGQGSSFYFTIPKTSENKVENHEK